MPRKTVKDLEQEIETLRKRVEELELRPVIPFVPVPYPYPVPSAPRPWQPWVYPQRPYVTWGSGSAGGHPGGGTPMNLNDGI